MNSGVLADPRPGAAFDYAPAPPEVVERARRLARGLRAARRPGPRRGDAVPARPSGRRRAHRGRPDDRPPRRVPGAAAAPDPAGAVGRPAGERPHRPRRRRSRSRHDRARRRRPPPPLGPGPRRLPVDDRRARRDPAAVRRRRTSLPLLDAAGVDATVLVQTRSSSSTRRREFLATAAATPFIARRRRLGRPDEPGRRRRPGRAPRRRRAATGWSGSATRSTTSPIPTGCCARTSGRGLAAVGRRGPRLRPARPGPRAAGGVRGRPGAAGRPVRHRPPREAADPRAARCRRGPSGSACSRRCRTSPCKLSGPGHRGGLGDLADRRPRARTSTGRSRCSGRSACCSARTGRSACSPRRTSGSSTTARALIAGPVRRTSRRR